ncbi:MAG: hypothetical protein AAFO95_08370 [Cyanobacteria bacterium J06600_6]
MIITESDRVILVAIAAGFLSGSFQLLLSSFLDRKKAQLFNNQQFLLKLLYSSVAHAIILGVVVFALSVWDTSMSVVRLNQFAIAMAVALGIAPLHNRLWSFLFFRLSLFQQKDTANH